MAMKYRKLGQQGLEVSALGLGCAPLSGTPLGSYGKVPDDVVEAIFDRAFELGVTMLDSAECYGPWLSEEQVGRAIKGRREKAIVATKYGFTYTPDGSSVTGQDGTAANAKRVFEASLKRLGTDYVDIYYLHRVDPNVPIEESVGAMAELVKEGKVRYLGLSEPNEDSLRRAHAVHPIAAVQSQYSLWERNIETQMLPVMRELGIGLVPFAPLGRGFLTGTLRSTKHLEDTDLRKSGFDPRFTEGNFEKNLRMVDAVMEVAQEQGISGAKVALAWLLSKGPDIVPIPGVQKVSELEDSFGAPDVQLTAEQIARLEAAAPIGGTAGNPYSEREMAQVAR
jgi:aryl-alcohol dehydrogenase-like predicted oxidoreductase